MFKINHQGFTLVELMIVIAIIGILGASVYPNVVSYLSRGRDVIRISDIKYLSAKFQEYSQLSDTYPDNTNKDGVTSYCINDILSWENALSIFPAKQYSLLGGSGSLRKDILSLNPNIGICPLNGSYFYSRIMVETNYSVLVARMENKTTGANWGTGMTLTSSASVDGMILGKPLNLSDTYSDSLFLIVTN